jgi:hypothetical protein
MFDTGVSQILEAGAWPPAMDPARHRPPADNIFGCPPPGREQTHTTNPSVEKFFLGKKALISAIVASLAEPANMKMSPRDNFLNECVYLD